MFATHTITPVGRQRCQVILKMLLAELSNQMGKPSPERGESLDDQGVYEPAQDELEVASWWRGRPPALRELNDEEAREHQCDRECNLGERVEDAQGAYAGARTARKAHVVRGLSRSSRRPLRTCPPHSLFAASNRAAPFGLSPLDPAIGYGTLTGPSWSSFES